MEGILRCEHVSKTFMPGNVQAVKEANLVFPLSHSFLSRFGWLFLFFQIIFPNGLLKGFSQWELVKGLFQLRLGAALSLFLEN